MRYSVIVSVFVLVVALGCGNGSPPPGQTDASALTSCEGRDAGCPSCATALAGSGAPGTTPADLCERSCSSSAWGTLAKCAGISCGPGPCGVGPLDDAHRSAACSDCLAAKCSAELTACRNDKE